jgi:parallel beta-helix repeat protein
MLIQNSDNNILSSNTIYNCSWEVFFLANSKNNTISRNLIFDNVNYGLFITPSSSENNTVTWNNFINNNLGFPARTSQAHDEGTTNTISNNYWEDWIGSGVYDIDGGANQDPTPHISPIIPVLNVHMPLPQIYDTDIITVQLSGNARHYTYYIAGIDTLNQTWTTSVTRTLADGSYTLHAYGRDFLGHTSHRTVAFTIDTNPPTIAITSPTATTYIQNSVTLTYTVSDGTVSVYLNGIVNTTAMFSGFELANLPDGIYNLTILAEDQVGNVGTSTVIFTIGATTTTTTTTDTTTTTTQASPSWTLIIVLMSMTALLVFRKRMKHH